MAAAGSMIELRTSPAQRAANELQAAVKRVLACAQEAEGAELGELLIQIRETGIDPLEAAFATGVRRFDKSGEYAADGALSVTAWLKWKCKLSGSAAAERVEIGKQLERLPKTEAAFARGDLGYQHVAVMARTAENLGAAAVQSEESFGALLQRPLTRVVIVFLLLLAALAWSTHNRMTHLRQEMARSLQKGEATNNTV